MKISNIIFIILFVLTIAVVGVRIVTGKYDSNYPLIFIWCAISTVPPIILKIKVSNSKQITTQLNLYLSILFFSALIIQPLSWELSRIGYVSFFIYSPIFFLSALVVIYFANNPIINSKKNPVIKHDKDVVEKNKIKEKIVFPLELKQKIKEQIANNEIEEAMKTFRSFDLPENIELPLVQLEQQWNDFVYRKGQGMLAEETIRVTLSNIIGGLLSLLETK